MLVYQAGQNLDLELLHWWTRLNQDGELDKLLGPSRWALGPFIADFSTCPLLMYDRDEIGWRYASWIFPFMGGGAFGCWIRPDLRLKGSRQSYNAFIETMRQGFKLYDVLVITTKQVPVVHKARKLGYTSNGEIPFLFEGETAYVLHMTKGTFEAKYGIG